MREKKKQRSRRKRGGSGFVRRAEQSLCDSSFRDLIAAYEDGEYHVLERYWTQGHARPFRSQARPRRKAIPGGIWTGMKTYRSDLRISQSGAEFMREVHLGNGAGGWGVEYAKGR